MVEERKKEKVEQRNKRQSSLCFYSMEFMEHQGIFQSVIVEKIAENPYGTRKSIWAFNLKW